jgi:hypothetical protein
LQKADRQFEPVDQTSNALLAKEAAGPYGFQAEAFTRQNAGLDSLLGTDERDLNVCIVLHKRFCQGYTWIEMASGPAARYDD